jgi:uncharacterized membrane protein
MRKRLILFFFLLFFTVSLFLAPFCIKKGYVKGLDGRAHHIDYSYIWNKMPLFPRTIYYIGDIGCHQKESRSFTLNENQMPICARDTGIFTGMTLALFFSLFVTPSGDFLRNLSQFYFKRLKNHSCFVFTILLLLPLTVDGFLQLLTSYESNNILRFFTGACAGISISFLALSSLLMLTE